MPVQPSVLPAAEIGASLWARLCHTKPTITSPLFGPQLSKAVVDGDKAAQARKQIADGSPNMPGFKLMYKPEQIDAGVEFLKLIPVPPPEQTRAAPAPRNPASQPTQQQR